MPNSKINVETNSQKDSKYIIKHKVITFDQLLSNYPSYEISHIDPVTKEDIFPDHCAIKLSESLYKCGVKLKSFNGTKCWSCPNDSNTHVIRAREFATWLQKRPFAGCPKPHIYTGKSFHEKINGKKGIIYFEDYWQRKEEKGTNARSGDHIDLWNENELASIGYFATQTRLIFSTFSEFALSMSDLERSKQVLFWEIN